MEKITLLLEDARRCLAEAELVHYNHSLRMEKLSDALRAQQGVLELVVDELQKPREMWKEQLPTR